MSKLGSFFRLGSAAVVEVEPVLEPPTRVRLQETLVGEVELAAYVKLAGEIGFTPGALLHHRLANFLRENSIDVYPTNKVHAFLDKTFGISEYRATWGWRPMREGDDCKLIPSHSGSPHNGKILMGRYNQIVPAPVLETVRLLNTHFQGSDPEIHFYVSDKVEPFEGDPFLSIRAAGMAPLIVERWNEPSFRR